MSEFRRRLMMAVKSSRLPKGYKEVEYIQNNGSAYIDTGIVASKSLSFNIKFNKIKRDNVDKHIFGSRSNYYNKNSGVQLESGSLYIKWGNNKMDDTPRVATYEMIEVYCKDGNTTVILDDSITLTYTKFYGNSYINGSMYLFAYNNNGSLVTSAGTVKIYKLIIYNDNDEPILDFVPSINPNNEVGMYDLVNNTFFRNQGNGTFIAGNPV